MQVDQKSKKEDRANEGDDNPMAHVLPERANTVTRLKFWRGKRRRLSEVLAGW